VSRCEVCQVRVGPCVEPAERAGNYAHEGVRLRQAQKAGGR
jgi:hypothetical protein